MMVALIIARDRASETWRECDPKSKGIETDFQGYRNYHVDLCLSMSMALMVLSRLSTEYLLGVMVSMEPRQVRMCPNFWTPPFPELIN